VSPARDDSVEIPEYSLLLKKGSHDVKDIVTTFPRSTRVLVWDRRLSTSDILPYWRWNFEVERNVETFRYNVILSIMGSPEEGLKYRDKAQAHWHRPELEAWAGNMLHRFEADSWDTWTAYRTPPTEAEEEDFKKMLLFGFKDRYSPTRASTLNRSS
jgi:hypothetical protein